MGADKLLLPLDGSPILQHVIHAATASRLRPLVLVMNRDNPDLARRINPGRCRVVRVAEGGYSASLQAGLTAAAAAGDIAGAMFILGDQPLVRTATMERLITAFAAEPHRWVAPVFRGQRGNPVITPAAWFQSIFALRGDTGPRRHLTDPDAQLKPVRVEDEGVVFDIDSPEDYARLTGVRLHDTPGNRPGRAAANRDSSGYGWSSRRHRR